MSSNVVYSNAQVLNNAPTHKKRPQHPSPVNSYRSAVERNGAKKRARWDITSPTPSPPVLSVPLPSTTPARHPSASSGSPRRKFQFAATAQAFQFGFDSSASSATTSTTAIHTSHRASRTKRHRVSTGSAYSSSSPYSSQSRTSTFPYHRHRVSSAAHHAQVVDPDDEPFFPLSTGSAAPGSAFALERLRRSTFDEGESFVNKMREWERERPTKHNQQLLPPAASHRVIPDAGKMGAGVDVGGHEDADGAMYSAASVVSYSSSSPPYSMSNSISSNSSTATSGSGSEGGPFAFGLSSSIGGSSSPHRPSLGGERKRSWSIVEGDGATSAYDGGEMDWEVVASAPRPSIGLRPKSTVQPQVQCEPVLIGESSPGFATLLEANIPGTETAEDGDDEQEDSSSSIDDDDSDDDLIFVIGNNIPTDIPHTAENAGQGAEELEQPSAAVSTERMISELSQVFAAGGADLEDHGMESEGFFELDLAGENAVPTQGHDAGALWQ